MKTPWSTLSLEALGWLSMLGILGSYFALSSGVLGQTAYNWIGIFTGWGMAVNLYPKKAWPAFWLNAIWGAISVYGVIFSYGPLS